MNRVIPSVSLWLIPPAGIWTLLQKGTRSSTAGTVKFTVTTIRTILKITVKMRGRCLMNPAKQQQQQRKVGGALGSRCSSVGSSSRGDGSGVTAADSSSSSSGVRVCHVLLMRLKILTLSYGGRNALLLLLLPATAGGSSSSSSRMVDSCRGSRVKEGGCRRAVSAGTS
jgi:hypothetical protein